MTTSIRAEHELGPQELRAQYPDALVPASTAEIEPLQRVVGQDRALEAIAFGLKVQADGYNIAVAGLRSSGRNTAVGVLVHKAAEGRPPVHDWCYLFNFDDPYRPRAVSLPTATGDDLKRDLARLVATLRDQLPTVFDDDSYDQRRSQALQGIRQEREQVVETLQQEAAEQGFLVSLTPSGFVTVPRGEDGQPVPPEAYQQLPEEERTQLEERARGVQEAANRTVRELRRLETRGRDTVEELDREAARFVTTPILEEFREKYPQDELVQHFTAIEKDVLDNIDTLKRAEAPGAPSAPPGTPSPGAAPGDPAMPSSAATRSTSSSATATSPPSTPPSSMSSSPPTTTSSGVWTTSNASAP